MNVCLISREYPPFFGGGIGTYACQTARALAEQGHHPLVVTVSGDGRETREQSGGITVARLPFLKGNDWSGPHPAISTPHALAAFRAFHPVSLFAMQVAAALPRLVDEFQIEAIDAPDTGALAWFALNDRRIGRGVPRQVPVVTVVHSPSAWVSHLNREPPASPREGELLHMEADGAAWSDALLCPSGALAAWAERQWGRPPGSIGVIPYPLGDLLPVARRSMTAPASGEPGRIIFVGRLEPRKGLETLIPGFARAVAAGADLRLDLIGQDMPDPHRGNKPFGRALLALLPPQVQSRVTIHGRLPPEEVARLRATARVAAVPSPTDNYPYSCVEAMACGQVVVAAAAGGMAEMVRDGQDGLLFSPENFDACAAALGKAGTLKANDAHALGQAAAERILDLCGNEKVIAQRVEHFRSLRPSAPAPNTDAVVLVTDRNVLSVDGPALSAVLGGDLAFAHGWTRDMRSVTAHPTPRLDRLAAPGPAIGPVAVRASAFRHVSRVEEAPCHTPGPRTMGVADTRRLAADLLRAGLVGAVVPHVVSEVRPRSLAARVLGRLSRGSA